MPQANSVPKIRAVIAAVASGIVDSEGIKGSTGLSQRHLHYYLHAARILGWVSGQLGNLQVTSRGRRLLASPSESDEERSLVRTDVEAMKIGPIVIPFIAGRIDTKVLASRLSEYADLSGATARRRAGCLKRWRDYMFGADADGTPLATEPMGSVQPPEERKGGAKRPNSEVDPSPPTEDASTTTGSVDCGSFPLLLFLELDELELSVRAHNCFYTMKLRFLGDLVQCTPEELLKLRNFGRTTLKEVESVILRLGLALGMSLPDWGLVDHEGVRRHCEAEIRELLDLVRRGEFTPTAQGLVVERAGTPGRAMNADLSQVENAAALFFELRNFDFSVRAMNGFNVSGIRFVGDLIQLSRSQLLDQRNLGRKTVAEIESFVQTLGFRLGTRLPGWDDLDHEKLAQESEDAQYEVVQGLDDAPTPTSLEEEVELYLTETLRPRTVPIALARIAWTSETDRTLADVGDEFGLTRERVRQITATVTSRAHAYRREFPFLLQCLSTIQCAGLSEASKVEEMLLAEGLTTPRTTLRAIRAAGRMLNLGIEFELEHTKSGTLVVTAATKGVSDRIASEARRITSRWGCGRVDDIVSFLKDSVGVEISQEAAQAALATVPGLSWLDDEKNWFWVATAARNRLLNNIDKTLAVAQTISAGELRSAVRRHHRMDGFAPPRRILRALCTELDDCEVEGDAIRNTGTRTIEGELSETERALRGLFVEHGPALHVRELEQFALTMGINRATFQMTLFNSPIFRRLAKGVYGLVGKQVSPGAVESAARVANVRRARVLQDWGWVSDTVVSVDYRLSEGSISNGVLSIPAAARSVLSGDFAVVDARDSDTGTLRVKANQVWGLLRVFARQEPEPGDFLRIEFDLDQRRAQIQIASEPPEDAEDSPGAILVG